MTLKKIICLGLPPIVLLLAATFVFGIFLIKWFWGWTVPMLFPGMVENGIIAGTITWFTALKLSILTSILVGISHLARD